MVMAANCAGIQFVTAAGFIEPWRYQHIISKYSRFCVCNDFLMWGGTLNLCIARLLCTDPPRDG
jgi:hypothetical protein